MNMIQLHQGDCLDVMRTLPDGCVDSVVADPPYGLKFMGKRWDHGVPSPEVWAEVLRVIKPGGYLLSFGGTRTYHRLVVNIEDAGFEIRDQIGWVFGSGFPKSLDVSKAIDKSAGRLKSGESVAGLKSVLIDLFNASGKTRKAIDDECGFRASNYLRLGGENKRPDPWVNVLPSQDKWRVIKHVLGCSVDLSPRLDAFFAEAEREVLGQTTKARSTSGASALPTLGGETVYKTWDVTAPSTDEAKTWQGWGTALKPAWEPICLARKPLVGTVAENVLRYGTGALNINGCRVEGQPRTAHRATGLGSVKFFTEGDTPVIDKVPHDAGRWPANLIHDGSDEVLAAFPTAPGQQGVTGKRKQGAVYGTVTENGGGIEPRGDNGSAARFFYCAKASKSDRGEGNVHPTVKPTDLMRYLCRLVTPVGGIVLDPFMGSGSTGRGAVMEGLGFIGIERDEGYFKIAQDRIDAAIPIPDWLRG